MDGLYGMASHDFRSALSVQNSHLEKHLHEQVEQPAGESAVFRLEVVNDGSGKPARSDGARNDGVLQRFYQVMESVGRRCSVGVDVADEVRQWGQF